MGVVFETGYTLPEGDQPLTHARIGHAGNWITGGAPAASGTASRFFAAGPDNSLTYEKWKPDAVPATWENDLGSAQDVDYCGIAAHTMGTNGNTVTVQYWDGLAWQDRSPAHQPTDDMPILFIFTETNAQRWRINISAGTAPVIGVVKFGKAMQMQQAIYAGHAPIDLARQTVVRSNYSETGEFLGKTKQRSYGASSFAWQHLTASWVRNNWRPFQIACEAEPFFIAWRPITFSEVAYGQTDTVPVPQNMGLTNLMAVSLSMRSRGYD